MSTPESTAAVLRRAAEKIQKLVGALPKTGWGDRPWDVTECSDEEAGECPCIVYQGEYSPLTEPQVPHIQYVADAEGPAFAAWIAAMHPLVGIALADWLDSAAEDAETIGLDPFAVAVARAFLGSEVRGGD